MRPHELKAARFVIEYVREHGEVMLSGAGVAAVLGRRSPNSGTSFLRRLLDADVLRYVLPPYQGTPGVYRLGGCLSVSGPQHVDLVRAAVRKQGGWVGGNRALAAETGLSVRAVRAALAVLVDEGELTVQPGAGRAPARYGVAESGPQRG